MNPEQIKNAQAYIQNLSHPNPHKPPREMNGKKFFKALDATYGPGVVGMAMRQFLAQSDRAYAGVTAFKERLQAAMNDGPISVADQQHIAKYAQYLSLPSKGFLTTI